MGPVTSNTPSSSLPGSTKRAIVFLVGTQYDRPAAVEDIQTITKTFQNVFNAEIVNWIDLENTNDLKSKIRELKTSDVWLNKFQEAHFVAIFCMAHGTTDGTAALCKCKDRLDIKRTLLNPFFSIKELDKKLKWLVVQCCRGNLNDFKGFETDSKTPTVGTKKFLDYHYISYCTEEGTISYNLFKKGEPEPGKVYLQKLCEELQRNAATKTLDEILTNVRDAVAQYASDMKLKNYSIPNFAKNCLIDYRFFDADLSD